MYVKDWMTKSPVCLKKEDSILDAYSAMEEGNFHRVPIVEDGKVVGLITGSTLKDYAPSKATTLSVFEINSILQKTKCEEIMIKEVITIDPDALVEEAADIMLQHRITCLPVVSKNTGMLVGIITQKVIYAAFIDLIGYNASGSRIVVKIEQDKPGILEDIARILHAENINITHLYVCRKPEMSVVIKTDELDAQEVADLLTQNHYIVSDYRSKKID